MRRHSAADGSDSSPLARTSRTSCRPWPTLFERPLNARASPLRYPCAPDCPVGVSTFAHFWPHSAQSVGSIFPAETTRQTGRKFPPCPSPDPQPAVEKTPFGGKMRVLPRQRTKSRFRRRRNGAPGEIRTHDPCLRRAVTHIFWNFLIMDKVSNTLTNKDI